MCTGNVAGQENVCMVRCQNPEGPFGGCVPVQLAGDIEEVANPTMSETGGSAEDDVNAIVDAAEEVEDGEEDGGNNGEEGSNDDEEGREDETGEGEGNEETEDIAENTTDDVGEGENGGEEVTPNDLFDRLRLAKARKLKRAQRIALRRHHRRAQRALKKAARSP